MKQWEKGCLLISFQFQSKFKLDHFLVLASFPSQLLWARPVEINVVFQTMQERDRFSVAAVNSIVTQGRLES